MVGTLSPPQAPRGRRRGLLVAAVVAVAVIGAVVAGLLIRDMILYTKKPPTFPSLATSPDPSLRGTIAYVEGVGPSGRPPDQRCVWVVAAAGQPSKAAWCFDQALAVGPLALAWRPDGRLQVTSYRWPTGQRMSGVWSKLVDIRRGSVEDVPQAQVPTTPPPPPAVIENPNGDRVTARSRSGQVTVTLSGPSGERTLLSAQGGLQYQLSFNPEWSPDWKWVLVNDGEAKRLLIITVDDPAQTRVLATNVASELSAGIPQYAVTGADLLTSQ